ncbi:unnamed protein product, partial [Prorocentrum cordatum]
MAEELGREAYALDAAQATLQACGGQSLDASVSRSASESVLGGEAALCPVPYRGETGAARRRRSEAARRESWGSTSCSSLAAAAVTPVTQDNYLNALRKLLAWMRVAKASRRFLACEWGLLLEQYVEFLHDRGLPEGDAASALAAVRWALPELPRPLRQGLPLATAAVTGWRRLEKPLSRPPVPRSLAILMALWLCADGKADYALFLLPTFETYMRPSEALRLLDLQLVPPVPGETGARRFRAILIRASELDVHGKTDEFDNSVALDLPRHRLLGPALRQLKVWSRCLDGLGPRMLLVTLYSLGRGGASEDVSSLSRALLDVRKRVGWRSFQSARRYDKHARLRMMMRRIPARLREEGYACIAFDELQGPHFDLGRRDVVAAIAGWMRAGLVWALWFATPCVTATRARADRSGRVPPPLRSSEHYRGLPDLSVRHRAKVRDANSLIDAGGSTVVEQLDRAQLRFRDSVFSVPVTVTVPAKVGQSVVTLLDLGLGAMSRGGAAGALEAFKGAANVAPLGGAADCGGAARPACPAAPE